MVQKNNAIKTLYNKLRKKEKYEDRNEFIDHIAPSIHIRIRIPDLQTIKMITTQKITGIKEKQLSKDKRRLIKLLTLKLQHHNNTIFGVASEKKVGYTTFNR